ncbi:restriction endonuclease subunit S [Pseudoalteromonas elyakovii]|nr:restriction endonuclease subunit S [Pseudoalteromonas elyakovii]
MTNFSGKNLNVACDGPKGGGMDSRRNAKEQQVPDGYKQTEVGVIPDDWGVSSFDDISSLIGDGIHTTPNYDENGDFYFVNGNNLVNGSISLDGNTKKTNLTEYKKHKKPLDQKTLLLSINGTIGNVAEYNNESIVLGKSAAFINVKKGAEKKYIFYVLGSHRTMLSFFDGLTGSTIKNLGLGTIRTTLLPLPHEKEQIAIASALSDVDALLTELEKLIAKKQAIKTATMQQLLTGKTRLPQFAFYSDESTEVATDTEGAVEGKSQGQPKHSSGTNVNVGASDDGSQSTGMDSRRKGTKPSELGEIPEDWDVVSIAKLTRNILDYRGRTPKKLGMDWGGGDIVALSAGNVKKGYIDFEEECYLGSDELYKKWMKNGDVEQNDIVFTMEAPLGNVALVPDSKRYILSQRTILLQLKREEYESTFVYQLMMSDQFQKVLSDSATGSTAQGIKRTRFEQLLLCLPSSKEEQTAIATILSDMDSEIQTLEQRLAKTRQIKQGMMQALLTGRTRLPISKEAV